MKNEQIKNLFVQFIFLIITAVPIYHIQGILSEKSFYRQFSNIVWLSIDVLIILYLLLIIVNIHKKRRWYAIPFINSEKKYIIRVIFSTLFFIYCFVSLAILLLTTYLSIENVLLIRIITPGIYLVMIYLISIPHRIYNINKARKIRMNMYQANYEAVKRINALNNNNINRVYKVLEDLFQNQMQQLMSAPSGNFLSRFWDIFKKPTLFAFSLFIDESKPNKFRIVYSLCTDRRLETKIRADLFKHNPSLLDLKGLESLCKITRSKVQQEEQGEPEFYLEKYFWDEINNYLSVCGICLSLNRVITRQDATDCIAVDRRYLKLIEDGKIRDKAEIGSMAAIPAKQNGKIKGVIFLFSNKKWKFTKRSGEFFEEYSHILGDTYQIYFDCMQQGIIKNGCLEHVYNSLDEIGNIKEGLYRIREWINTPENIPLEA